MITKINSLESFGPFATFEWPTGLSDFAPRNVLFGWNATGKTSVSRLLACLEHRAIFPQDDYFRNAHFCIETDDGGSVTEETLASSPAVRVYNEDFVKRQFTFAEDQRLSAINCSFSVIIFNLSSCSMARNRTRSHGSACRALPRASQV